MQNRQRVIAITPLRRYDVRLEGDFVAKQRAGAGAVPDQAVERREQDGAFRAQASAQAFQVSQPIMREVDRLTDSLNGYAHRIAQCHLRLQQMLRASSPA